MLDVKVGDKVNRWLSGIAPMKLKVTEITDTLIICGAWKFDKQAGYEIDEELRWGEKDADGVIQTGSFITKEV
jgi:hypothetical protein